MPSTTPGIAATAALPDSQRTPPEKAANMPHIPTTPLCYADARPILENLGGPLTPRPWQGALPFAYHLGPGPVRVKIHLKQDYQYRTIWNVVGKIPGTQSPDEWVIAGNHRDICRLGDSREQLLEQALGTLGAVQVGQRGHANDGSRHRHLLFKS